MQNLKTALFSTSSRILKLWKFNAESSFLPVAIKQGIYDTTLHISYIFFVFKQLGKFSRHYFFNLFHKFKSSDKLTLSAFINQVIKLL